jgi:hypothetical protein
MNIGFGGLGKQMKDNITSISRTQPTVGNWLKIRTRSCIRRHFPLEHRLKKWQIRQISNDWFGLVSHETQRKAILYDPDYVIPMASEEYFPVLHRSTSRTALERPCSAAHIWPAHFGWRRRKLRDSAENIVKLDLF